MARRAAWLLFLLAGGDPAHPREFWLDPIRIMKGLFLAQMERDDAAPTPVVNAAFEFVPYSYGPFAPMIYAELDSLRASGLAINAQVYGKSYRLWALSSPAGWEAARTAAQELTDDERARIRHAHEIVTSKSFNDLLQYVYRRYPDSASRSMHEAARQS